MAGNPPTESSGRPQARRAAAGRPGSGLGGAGVALSAYKARARAVMCCHPAAQVGL